MKKMNFTVVALSALLVLGSCGTSQKTGTAAGAGAGAALGAIVGGLLNNSHRGTGAVVGQLGNTLSHITKTAQLLPDFVKEFLTNTKDT